MYHNIDTSIDTVMPELKPINSRIANLISAKNAVRNRTEILSKQDPMALGNLLSLPIRGTVGSTTVKSGLAKVLSEKFGLVGKAIRKAGKMGKQTIPIMGITTSIFDAIKYSEDPEGYMIELLGGEPAPKGSQDREIQTGRLL